MPIKGCSTNYLTNISQNSQGNKKKMLRNCHNQEELKETWLLNVTWYPGWDPGTEKKY